MAAGFGMTSGPAGVAVFAASLAPIDFHLDPIDPFPEALVSRKNQSIAGSAKEYLVVPLDCIVQVAPAGCRSLSLGSRNMLYYMSLL